MELKIVEEYCQKLRMFGMKEYLEQRVSQAEQDAIAYPEFLSLVLQDELQTRQAKQIASRIKQARFEEEKTFEALDKKRYPTKVQRILREISTLGFLKHKKNVIIMGPTGTGKSHVAQALGFQACLQGKSVRFIRANQFYRELNASRADDSWEKTFKQFIRKEILIIDDFGLKGLNHQQADDIYELIAERHHKGGMIFTSNRSCDAWVKLFPDQVLSNAALDRLANTSYQIILEGESYRKKMRPNLDIDLEGGLM